MFNQWIQSCFRRYVSLCAKHPFIVLLIIASLTFAAASYTSKHYSVELDTAGLIKTDAPWKTEYAKLESEFPWQRASALMVVTGDEANRRSEAISELKTWIQQNFPDSKLLSPTSHPWLKARGVYLLPLSEQVDFFEPLQTLLPTVRGQMDSPNMSRYLVSVAQSYQEASSDEQRAIVLAPLIDLISKPGEDLEWGRYIEHPDSGFDIVLLQPAQGVSPSAFGRGLREFVDSRLDTEISWLLSGRIPMDQEELDSAQASVTLTGLVSLAGLLCILGFALRSVRAIFSIYASVGLGLIWTVAFGVWAVGAYNPISVVFLVMFIGLGVDFAIHYYLRLVEDQTVGDQAEWLGLSFVHSFKTIALCALTTSIGFLSFSVTDYRGLADLGIISAGGMLLAVIATFTVLPICIRILGVKSRHDVTVRDFGASWLALSHPKTIMALFSLLFVASLVILKDIRFDFSTLALKDESAPSMVDYRTLSSRGVVTDYSMSLMTTDGVNHLSQQFLALEEVERVDSLSQFLPRDFEATSGFFSQLEREFNRPADDVVVEFSEAVATLKQALFLYTPDSSLLAKEVSSLYLFLGGGAADIKGAEAQLTRGLMPLLQQLHGQQSTKWSADDLPVELGELYLSPNDVQLITIVPSLDMNITDDQARFVDAVKGVDELAIGRPLAELAAAEVVLESFKIAATVSCLAICLTLLILRVSLVDIALVFVPIIFTLVVTLALTVIFNKPLNMANIIVVPLVAGLGVDNALHIVRRIREEGSVQGLFNTSTPFAAILSSLTTIATFGSLLFATHQGMHSIGFILTTALVVLLLATLVLLPSVVFLWERYAKTS